MENNHKIFHSAEAVPQGFNIYSKYRRAEHSLQIFRLVVLVMQFRCHQTYTLQRIIKKLILTGAVEI